MGANTIRIRWRLIGSFMLWRMGIGPRLGIELWHGDDAFRASLHVNWRWRKSHWSFTWFLPEWITPRWLSEDGRTLKLESH